MSAGTQPGAGEHPRPFHPKDGEGFLKWVWPEKAPFYICAALHGRGRMQHFPVPDAQTAFEILKSESANGFETYYAFAAFDAPRRTKQNVHSLRVFVWDVDVGKKGAWATKEEALKDVRELAAAHVIPSPSAVIDSGGGLHLYWRVEETLRREEWEVVARQLKRLMQAKAPRLAVDTARAADAAGLLRVPGTLNHKRQAPVQMIEVRGDWRFADFRQFVEERTAILPMGNLTQATPAVVAEQAKGFVGDIGVDAAPPPSLQSLIDACAVFRDAYEHQETEGYEGWYPTVQLCVFTKEGRQAAHEVSRQHPQYTPEETDSKYDSALRAHQEEDTGPTTCEVYCAARNKCNLCLSCDYAGTVSTPIQAARQLELVQRQRQQLQMDGEAPPFADLFANFNAYLMQLKAYTLVIKKNRVLIETMPGGKDRQHVSYHIGREVFLPAGRIIGEDGRLIGVIVAKVTADLRKKLVDISVLSPSSFGGEAIAALTRQLGLVSPWEASSRRILGAYLEALWSYCSQAGDELPTIHKVSHYGWTADGFAFGEWFIHKSGEIRALDWSRPKKEEEDEENKAFVLRGSEEAALDTFFTLLETAPTETRLIMLTSLAAPLVALANQVLQFSPILYVWGPSGTGKTHALRCAAGIWGSERYIAAGNSTSNFLYSRADELRNLPLLIDEMTAFSPQEPRMFFSLLFDLANCSSRGRADRSGKAKAQLKWATTFLMTSNHRFDALLKNETSDAARAALARVVTLASNGCPPEQAVQVLQLAERLLQNAGRVGMWWLRRIVPQRRAIRQRIVGKLHERLQQVEGDQRYLVGLWVLLEETIELLKEKRDMTSLLKIMREKLALADPTPRNEERELEERSREVLKEKVGITPRQETQLEALRYDLRRMANGIFMGEQERNGRIVTFRPEPPLSSLTAEAAADYNRWKYVARAGSPQSSYPIIRTLTLKEEKWAFFPLTFIGDLVRQRGEALTLQHVIQWFFDRGDLLLTDEGEAIWHIDPLVGEIRGGEVVTVPSLSQPTLLLRVESPG